ncbi:hypothetical protein TVAG_433210 [Trichomonas vaginalis G3]|uniref:Uncharacterized protein n=1 Tax=Trichomonas vaginalis (strain ATCC PRA-98 / G3) TaxID=412133 RepID=A2DIW2_TRIV3|nr:tetratricopeptide repeat domain domain-containing protein [Trichomonas vaginalis G3]EAY19725.1 hypothetical protein TVAG_433210 [Trichomonas vaginalis G3]KAI5521255.1 tetratricopeptide repeat domain domain-containing protein [Trichomonas vaginalis G3]|eukprot:XP_001580711.1 hypothetical protein [Trichomonas vaginalis G3]
MVDANVDNDISLAMISVNARFGDSKAALELYNRWGDRHLFVPVDVKLALIDSLLNSNDIKIALQICDHILQDKQTTNPQQCGQLLKLLSARDLQSDVLRIHEILRQNMVAVDSVGADCVVLAAIRNTKNITEELVDSIAELRPTPSAIVAFSRALKLPLIKRVPWVAMVKSTRVIPLQSDSIDMLSSLIASSMYDAAFQIFSHWAKCGLEANGRLVQLAFIAMQGELDFDNLNMVYNYAREAEVPISPELASNFLLSAIEVGNIAVALSVKDEMDADSVKLCDICVFEESSLQTPQEQPTRPVRVRRRSSTCPKMRMAQDDYIYQQFLADDNDFI